MTLHLLMRILVFAAVGVLLRLEGVKVGDPAM